jgi:hypothetical protein
MHEAVKNGQTRRLRDLSVNPLTKGVFCQKWRVEKWQIRGFPTHLGRPIKRLNVKSEARTTLKPAFGRFSQLRAYWAYET